MGGGRRSLLHVSTLCLEGEKKNGIAIEGNEKPEIRPSQREKKRKGNGVY